MQTVILNAKIYIEKGRFVPAMLINGNRIALVGTEDEVRAAAAPGAGVIDAEGKLILPGMNDSHQHLFNVGQRLTTLDLGPARSIADVIDMGRRFLAEHPEQRAGLYAAGWNQDNFSDVQRPLNRHDLDCISREIPLYFERICGHIAAANTCALALAGIAPGSPQPEGGCYDVGPDGLPDGVLREHATDLVSAVMPKPTEAVWRDRVLRALDYAVSVGLTSVQSNDASQGNIDMPFSILRELRQEGRLPLRYRHQVSFHSADAFAAYIKDHYRPTVNDDRLAVGPLKLFKDGSLGARTALLRNDYCDDAGNRGVEALSDKETDALCALAQKNGVQVVTHVIGDGAVEKMLCSYEKILAGRPNTLRHGLVHCQITDAQQLERIGKMGILTLVQPIFLHYDSRIVHSRVGAQLAGTSYAFRTLMQQGSSLSFGTDAPVEDCNPFPCIAAAVNRTDEKGLPAGGFNPGERMTVAQAVDSYTCGSAYAEFCERDKGRLKPGYLADLIMVDRDIFAIDPLEIGAARVLLTMVGGEVVYQNR